ncbi:DNA repair protein, Rad [Parasponia andersonii]|uniref:E3 ubiquitin-protein ligase RMA n=1 Tax=Parasponia andersonii TaxID=3476 RepID=A0A2P5DZV0_PARAD|nr:DNA repair protein, Rad [Parasponia andersonii]
MENDNIREDILGLDLNQEPLDQSQYSWVGLESILNELETAQDRIEERIRHLEAVTSRARERRRWLQGRIPPPTVDVSAVEHATGDARNDGVLYGGGDGPIVGREGMMESGNFKKRNCAHLIAKALEMNSNEKIGEHRGGGFFDCNICLEMAMEPILTCCGHLFCWPCFYHLPYEYDHTNVKECPVCGGEVMESTLVPIYGNGDGNYSCKSKESGLEFPPRPQAKRVESKRQCRINRGLPLPSARIEERIQLLTNIVGTIEERTSSLLTRYQTETLSNQRRDIAHFSRQTLQADASFSSLSSALNSAADSAGRLIDSLETYNNGPQMRITGQQSLHIDNSDAASVLADITQAESQTSDTAAGSSYAVLPSTLSFLIDIDPAVPAVENQRINTEETYETEISSSSRRMSGAPRVPRESRRRRLR